MQKNVTQKIAVIIIVLCLAAVFLRGWLVTSPVDRIAGIHKPATATVQHTQRTIAGTTVAFQRRVYALSGKKQPLPARGIDTVIETLPVDSSMVASPFPQPGKLLDSFCHLLQEPTQFYTINNSRDTTLYAKEGTEIYIPAFAFTKDSSHTLTGITMVVDEYYRYNDMIAAKLYTNSNGDQLVTGGMLHIAALYKGEQLELQQQKEIGIKMPAREFNDSMQLFMGQEQQTGNDTTSDINWVTNGQQQMNHHPLPQIWVANPDKGFMRDVYTRSLFGGGTTWAGTVFAILPGENKEAKRKELAAKYPDAPSIRIRKLHSLSRQYAYLSDSVQISWYAAAWRNLLTAADTANYINSLKREAVYKNERSMYTMAIAQLESKYNFSVKRMGWINCDRFYKDKRPKVTFAVNLGNSKGKYVSYLLFTRIRSVMPCYMQDSIAYFPHVPEGEPVRFVSIGARNNTIVSCMKQLVISKKRVDDLAFDEVKTDADFKKQLKGITPP